MNFELICKRSMKDIGIIDENGHFDMDKFQQHIENCEPCLDLMESFANFMTHQTEKRDARKNRPKRIPSARHTT